MRHSRHIRRSKRTLTRAQMLARNMKRRAPAPAEVEAAPEPQLPAAAPYDPVSVPVRKLPDTLAAIEDAETVRVLKSADPRASAAQHYDARLAELVDA